MYSSQLWARAGALKAKAARMNGIERILGFLPYERMHWDFPNGCPLVATAEIKRIFHLAPSKRNPVQEQGTKCAT